MTKKKDRFSDHQDIFDEVRKATPAPIWWVVGPKIRKLVLSLGMETRPKELRQRHTERIERFREAGRKYPVR